MLYVWFRGLRGLGLRAIRLGIGVARGPCWQLR